ncbi:hypothetical protein GQ53DRAFT_853224 [Thozetella sp. PMI_491]|nr:hypothetical protein GQ53DRAFT_853224 [Thozetella sp. PMI_491]
MSSTHSGSSPSTTKAAKEKQPCWECLRRRLVCDCTLPFCNKCRLANITCPGYSEKKPVKWLPPGKIKSRSWKRKKPSAPEEQLPKADKTAPRPSAVVPLRRETIQPRVTHIIELPEETIEMFEAATLFRIAEGRKGATPSPFSVTFMAYQQLNPSQRHTLVTVAINHRILKLLDDTGRPTVPELASRLHHHRGLAIRALNHEIEAEEGKCGDSTIASILLLMFADVQQIVKGNWRSHARALDAVFASRGGLRRVANDRQHLRAAILGFLISIVMGNTTTPAAAQTNTRMHKDLADFFAELYEELEEAIVFPCPLPLFLEIIHINDLRYRIATASSVADRYPYASEAHTIMQCVTVFSPEEWAKRENMGSYPEEWLCLGRLCHSAVLLYTLSSLRSVLGPLATLKTQQRDLLFEQSKAAVLFTHLSGYILWPLVVAGMQAAEAGPEEREWIDAQLLSMGRRLGTNSPLLSRAILRKFWKSGKTGWNDCFDQPHVFIA